MGETTGIAWTRSTFNPVIGCTRISPGCDSCYAEALDRRHRWGGATHWGAGVPRMRTSESNWNKVHRWNKLAEAEQRTGLLTPKSDWPGKVGFWPVFCASLADVFDNEWPDGAREDLWRLIRATPNLSWLLLTKRIGNVEKMHPGGDYQNLWIGASIVNQPEADRDLPKLLAVKGAAKLFVSYEPALEAVDFSAYVGKSIPGFYPTRGIDWIIVGGESSQGKNKARAFDLEWARETVAQCKAASVACFVKQIGSTAFDSERTASGQSESVRTKDRVGADPAEWPADLRVQQFPS